MPGLLGAFGERSKRRGWECELSEGDLQVLIARSGGRCEVTGVRFSDYCLPGWTRGPFAPTVDRIDGAKPYSLNNCRLVCMAVNVSLNEWGEAIFAELARAYVLKKGPGAPGSAR